jgi:DNA (cytosine-5)-methyltransferase 1
MENVSGMVRQDEADLRRNHARAEGIGLVSARLMNKMYFGLPQSRERMIFIGVREDLWDSILARQHA